MFLAKTNNGKLKKIRFFSTLPKNLINISIASYFWSFSTLIIASILPIYMSEVLGASGVEIGILEGVAVSFSYFIRLFAGITSDYFRNRKVLIAIGSAFNVFTKILFALSGSVLSIFIARSLDRIVKGFRSSPTDAFIADISEKGKEASSFGFKQSVYTFGAVSGTIAAWYACQCSISYNMIFSISIIPAVTAFLIVQFGLTQPKIKKEINSRKVRLHWRDFSHFSSQFFILILFSSLLMLARFSTFFISIHARDLGCKVSNIPFIIVLFCLGSAIIAYPAGKLADKIGRYKLILFALFFLLSANTIFISTNSILSVFIGSILFGAHFGIIQGSLVSLISSSVQSDLRGSAYAIYYFTGGMALFLGNTNAGYLCDKFGTTGPFLGGLVISLVIMIFFIIFFYKKIFVNKI